MVLLTPFCRGNRNSERMQNLPKVTQMLELGSDPRSGRPQAQASNCCSVRNLRGQVKISLPHRIWAQRALEACSRPGRSWQNWARIRGCCWWAVSHCLLDFACQVRSWRTDPAVFHRTLPHFSTLPAFPCMIPPGLLFFPTHLSSLFPFLLALF